MYYKRYTDFPEFEKPLTDNFSIIQTNIIEEFGGIIPGSIHPYNCSRFTIQSNQHPENTFFVAFDDFNKGFVVTGEYNMKYDFKNYEEFKNIVY